MPATKKESLPQLQIGVREGGNIRMKKMARPICPVVDDPESPKYTGEPNCQRMHNNYPGWWDYCANQGHEPYFTVKKKTVKEDVEAEDGSGLVTGERKRVLTTRKLNMVQVAIGTRFNSGHGERYSRDLKGRKTLSEFGYAEKCEFRNCELDAKLKSKYGMFCGDRHARLIGADVEGLMLSVKKGEAAKELRGLDIEFEGTFVIQTPPDLDEPSL